MTYLICKYCNKKYWYEGYNRPIQVLRKKMHQSGRCLRPPVIRQTEITHVIWENQGNFTE